MGCGGSTPDKAAANNNQQSPQQPAQQSTQQPAEPEKDAIFKAVFIGDSYVGKSSLLLQYTDGTFSEDQMQTIGMDFKVRTIELEGKTFTLQMFDMAGQERYRTIIASYYKGAHGIMVLYDVTNRESFNSVKNWFSEIERYASENVAKILVGNKCDETEHRVIDFTMAKEFADEIGVPFLEVSAKTGTNVDETFMTLVSELRKKQISTS